MAQPLFSIIIPALNEAERLPATLLEIDRYFTERGYSAEILVVNDGSKDRTADVVLRMKKHMKNLKLIDNAEQNGKGAAVRQGMLLARGAIRLFMDADQLTSINHVEAVLSHMKEGHDVVVGSRAVRGKVLLSSRQPLVRRCVSALGNLLIQACIVPGIWDTQCGFKAFTEDAAERIFGVMKSTRFGFDVEALGLARAFSLRVKEIPVEWRNSSSLGVIRGDHLHIVLELCKIRWRLWNFDRFYKVEERSFFT